MCGIVGFTGDVPAGEILLDALQKLEYRGYDSAGIVLSHRHKFYLQKTSGRIGALKAKTNGGKSLEGFVGIGHTRWATHGGPTEENAHPHLSFDKKFAVVHNGIIENYAALKEELISDGVVFLSETDTEVIPNLIAKYYKGDFLLAVKKATKRLVGSYALGVLCADFPDTIIAVRNLSPLIVGLSNEKNFIASDVTALVSHTKKVVYLDDGEMAVLTPNHVEFFGAEGSPVHKEKSKVDWDVSLAEKGGYDHFMMKEIAEQPRAVKETVSHRIKDGKVFFEGLSLSADRLKTFKNISVLACGSAYHAGIVGKYILEELLRTPVNVDLASEYRYRNPITDKNTLTIVISQSGETADTLAALREAKSRGSYILSIVNVVGSSVAKESDDVIYTRAGPEIAVATTKGYSTQLATLYLFAVWAADLFGTYNKDELKSITEDILKIPEAIEECLKQKGKIKEMAKRSCYIESIFFIGRNLDYAVSLEASLKLKEVSYIHSEAYAAGELKHGTISLIEHGTTVMALCCHTPLFEKMVSNVKEVKARGAFVVATANEGNREIEKEADEIIYIPKLHPLLLPSLEVIPFQLYAYYVALFKDCDVDKPRNLAKSVTVE